jgi:cyclic 2,3-diphosphoglycerate synthetase
VVSGEEAISVVEKALEKYSVEAVVDLSDEPVVGYRERMRIASLSLAAGARYVGSDFEFKPPELRRVSDKPSLAVIGMGKRVGKTGVTGYLAQLLAREGYDPAVVSMGRGGPPEPEIVRGDSMEVGDDYLLEALSRGVHAASDYYETAALSRVVTVGCRRCGGGLAGEPLVSNVVEGAEVADGVDAGMTVFDGSGAAIPPVAVDRRVLVVGAHQDPEYIAGYFGAYRLAICDLVLLTMSEEPLADREKVREILRRIQEVRPGLAVVPTVFRPRPMGSVEGMKVGYVSTAPSSVLDRLSRYLEEHYGCEVVGVSGALSDRARLEKEMEEIEGAEAYLTEIKAAAIDVVSRRASEEGKPVFYCDNEPEGEGLEGAVLGVARSAAEANEDR